jgi:hypothetical protein
MHRLVERALAAQRASRRIALRPSFDASSDADWSELVRDIAALANSGGGVVLFGAGVELPDRARIEEELARVTAVKIEFSIVQASNTRTAIVVEEAETPVVFAKGVVYFRHGAKSEPVTSADLEDLIRRRLHALRRSWLGAVRRVVEAPGGTSAAVLPREIRDSDEPGAMPIRVVHDPRAPAFRVVDYDKTHPFRQKEVLSALRERLKNPAINAFDLQAVRHVHHTDDNPDFAHKPAFATRQYSVKFIDWLVEQAQRDPDFFRSAREQYIRTRRQAS